MVKLFLAGCLTLLLGGVLSAGACWVVASGSVAAADRAVATGRAQQERLNRAFPFTPPADGEETAAGLERLLKVRRAVQAALARRPATRAAGWEDLRAPRDALGRHLDARLKDRVVVTMRALESQRMSPREYLWHLKTVYGAVFAGAAAGNGTARKLARDLQDHVPAVLEKLGPLLGLKGTDLGTQASTRPHGDTVRRVEAARAEFVQPDLVVQDVLALSLLDAPPP